MEQVTQKRTRKRNTWPLWPAPSWWRSFQGRLTLTVLAILLFVLALSSAYSVQQFQMSGETEARRIELTSAQILSLNIDFYYSQARLALTSTADDYAFVTSLANHQTDQVDSRLESLSDSNFFDSAYIVSVDGRLISSSTLFGLPKPDAAFLRQFVVQSQKGLYAGSPAASSYPRITHSILPMAVSIPDLRGGTLGVLVGEFSLQRLNQYISNTLLAHNGLNYVLADTSDAVLSSSLPARNPQTHLPGPLQQLRPGPTSTTRQGTFRVGPRQTEYLGTSIRLSASGWVLFLAQPSQRALEPARQLVSNLLAFGLITLVIALILCLLLGQQFSRPLEELNRVTREIAHGNYTLAIAPSGLDDTDRLAGSFQLMVAKITEAQDTLRRHNDQLAALYAATLEVVNRMDIPDLRESIVAQVTALLGAPRSFLVLIPSAEQSQTDELYVKTDSESFGRFSGLRFSKGEGAIGTVWETGQPLVIADYAAWSQRLPIYERSLFRSLAAVPLLTRSGIIGVLGVAYQEAGQPFGAEKLALLTQMAQVASLALQNATLFSAVQDELSKRRQTETALLESNRQTRRILESISDAFFTLKHDQQLTYVNPQAEAYFQKPGQDLYGKNLLEEFPQLQEYSIVQHLCQAQEEQHKVVFEEYSPELAKWFEVRIYPSPDSLAVYFHDITGRKQEEKVQQELIQAREAERTQRELAQTKDRFLSMVSHELRNPMAAVVGFSELLSDRLKKLLASLTPETPIASIVTRLNKLQDFVNRIEHQGKQMTQQVTDLLDMSRMDTGKFTLKPTPFDLAGLATQVIAQQQLTTTTHRISYSGPEHVSVRADQSRLDQVLTNLISNAVRYSPDGGTIHVTLEQEDGTTAERAAGIYWSVSDEGLGIPADAHAHLFDYNYQVERPDQESRGGLGLGLYLCKQIVDLHGGTISVESEPGKGSTFIVWLPPTLNL